LTSVNIPDSVTNISYKAFNYCTSLRDVTLPRNLSSIVSDTFSGCSALTSINIPPSVTSIHSSAFFGCSKLTSITLPNNLMSIDVDAFAGSGLTSIAFPPLLSQSKISSNWKIKWMKLKSIPQNIIKYNSNWKNK
jgi:hypothetical protein